MIGGSMKYLFRKGIVFLSVLFLSGMVLFYGYRLIHFYQLEQGNKNTVYTMIEYLTREENLLKNKLLKQENQYYFDAFASNNYLYYSGILYRILSFDEENLLVIADDCVTYLKYGIALDYNSSDIYKWLNEVYLSNLNPQYLANQKVDLLTKEMFSKMGGKDSFLVGEDFWILDNEQGLIVTKEGEITKPTNYDAFIGIKPTLLLKGQTKYMGGDGTRENPYILEDRETKSLADLFVGEYIRYQNQLFRVVEKNDLNIRVISLSKLDAAIPFSTGSNDYNEKTSSLSSYLNHEYYETLKQEDVVKTAWKNGEYHFDYQEVAENSVSSYVGLLTVGDYFITDFPNSFLLAKSGNNIYAINQDKFLYEEIPTTPLDIYPSFTLKGDLKVQSGKGYLKNPYVVGE